MKRIFAFLALALFCTANLQAQIVLEVVQLDLDSSVTIPAGDVTVAIFLPGNVTDPMGATPPNGDLVFIGGNTTGAAGFLASAGSDVFDWSTPADIRFPASNFLIACADATGAPILSNHTYTIIVNDDTSLTTVDSILVGIEAVALSKELTRVW